MAAKRPEGVGPTGTRPLATTEEGQRFTRNDPLCRLRRHLPLEGGDSRPGYMAFIASHDTSGFMSAKVPVGFFFQAQTCSS